MKIEAGLFKEFFKIPKSKKKISYNKKIDVKTKIKKITMYCIEECLYWDTDSEENVLEEEFSKYLFGPSKLQGLDALINGKVYIEYLQAIEDEFCIEISDEAFFNDIESLTNVICSELKIKE